MPTALIADDEPLLLVELRDLLTEAWPDLQIVAEASTGAEALRLLHALEPDIAFLDIEMPRINGMDVAAALQGIRVVFVTAHDRHATTAFDLGVLDYVMKPVTPARLALAVQRLKRSFQSADGNGLRFVQAWQGKTMRVVAIEDIVAFISEDKYTRVVTTSGDLLLRRSLVDLRADLDGAEFWPVNRGTVIHARYIEQIEKDEGRDLQVRMRSLARPILVGRQYRERFRGM